MKTFKKILVPTDFSEASEKAYPVAQKLASVFGGKIDFVHVIPTGTYLHESLNNLSIPLSFEKDIFPKIIAESETRVSEAMESFIPEKLRGEIFVEIDRKPSEAIINLAKKSNYDMIVMGNRGKDKTSLFRGGTTERVIRYADVAVFSVDSAFDTQKIGNILVPTDSSSLSFTAFPMAALLADAFDASLTLFHVLELYGTLSDEIPRDPDKGEDPSIYDALIDRLMNYLDKYGDGNIGIKRSGEMFDDLVVIKNNGDSKSIPLHTQITHGISAHYEIDTFAHDFADLVVMATHGYSGLSHLLLGSTAEKVTQYVGKPVITIRPDKSMFDK